MKSFYLLASFLVLGFFLRTNGQVSPSSMPVQEKSLEDVIGDIDALLIDIENSSENITPPVSEPSTFSPTQEYFQPVVPKDNGRDQSFRLKNELVPGNLLNRVNDSSDVTPVE